MTKTSTLMATLILIGCGLLIAAPASAMSPKPGQGCIMWICWDKPNQWKPNYGGRANLEAEQDLNHYAMWGNHGGNIFDPQAWKNFYSKENWHVDTLDTTDEDTRTAMWTPTYELKAWYCMKGNMGKQMQHKDSTCIGGTPRPVYGRRSDLGTGTAVGTNDTVIAMMTQEMLDGWRASLRKYSSATIDLDTDATTQFARGRGTTCSANPYGRRSAYCANPEVEAPVEQTTAFGQCLLDDQPVELETLTDCRSDACLGRKFYYGPVGRVGR